MLLARPGKRFARPRRDPAADVGAAPEDSELQGLEGDRVARLEGDRRCLRRHVLELADPAAGLAEQGTRVDAPGTAGVGVDQDDGRILGRRQIAAREAEQADHRAVGCRDLGLRTFDIERRAGRAHGVDRGHEAGEIQPRPVGLPGPVAGPARDHVHARPAAVLVAHRHQDAGREGRGEQVAEPVMPLELGGLRIAELDREALGVVVLGEGDGRRDPAVKRILLEQPGGPEIPPFGAVEQIVEAGTPKRQDLVRGAAEGLGEEPAVRVGGLGRRDQGLPDLGRHLVGGIAAEALEAELQVVAHELHPAGGQRRPVARVVVVDLGEVAPDRVFARVDRIEGPRRAQLAVRLALEPLRVLLDQKRVLGSVVDHQIHHHRDAAPGGGFGEGRQQQGGLAAVLQQRVQPVEILDRIQAAREARVVERVEVEPVEAHAGDPVEMAGPGRHRPGEQREEVVDAWSRHSQTRWRRPKPDGVAEARLLWRWPRPPRRRPWLDVPEPIS